jgi:hypothetical protein
MCWYLSHIAFFGCTCFPEALPLMLLLNVQASRAVPDLGGCMLQEITKVEIDPLNGVDGPLAHDAIRVSRYYPGAQPRQLFMRVQQGQDNWSGPA